MSRSAPYVIVHQLTAIRSVYMRHFYRDFAMTNRLRTEETYHLLSAKQTLRVRLFFAQRVGSYAAYALIRVPFKSEEDPLDTTPVR